MKNKKLRVTLALLSTTLLLSGCNKISADLSNGSDAIVVDKDGSTVNVEQNEIKEIFDAIKNGDNYTGYVNSMVKEALAKAYVGEYKVDKDGKVYIEGLDIDSDSSVIEFVTKHQFYRNWVSTSSSVNYEDTVDSSKVSLYRNRINAYIDLVEKEMIKSLYNDANSSSYKKNSKFYESLYVRSLYASCKTLYNKDGSKIDADDAELLYTTPDYKNESNKEEFENAGYTFGKLITREYDVENNYKAIVEGDTALLHLYHYVDYINNQILPDITSNLLTESYIFEKQYQSIGRSKTRKINFVKIADNSNNQAPELMRAFIEKYLVSETESNVSYSTLIDAWTGDHVELSKEENKGANELAKSVFGNESTLLDSEFVSYIDGKSGEDYPYYDGSKYGDLIKDYSYLTNNPTTNDSSKYSDFTSFDNLTYEPEEGLEIKRQQLACDSYVTSKWGTSSSFDVGSTDIVTSLFSYGLASEFKTAKDNDTTFIVDGYYLKQFVKGGPTFLKKTSYTNEIDSILWENDDNYYIIEVVDQVGLDTLSLTTSSTDSEKETVEDYARTIGYTVASGDTYTSNAILYYLEKSNINYHDQDVYDYFKDTYPDLFD